MNRAIEEARRQVDEWEGAFAKREGDWWESGPEALEAAVDTLDGIGEGDPARSIADNVRSTVERKWLGWASRALNHGNVEEGEADFLLLSAVCLIPVSSDPKAMARPVKRLLKLYWPGVRG